MRTFIIVSVAILGSTPAVGQGSGQPAASSNASAGTEKKICRRIETSGSRMTERVCLTAQQWKKLEAEGR